MNQQIYSERNYSFGQALLNLRSLLGLTQKELGSLLGVARHTIGTWEGGSKYPSATHLKEFITLAVIRNGFHGESVSREIRSLWNSAHQKVSLDEKWLASLFVQPSVFGLQGQNLEPLETMPGSIHSESATQIQIKNQIEGKSGTGTGARTGSESEKNRILNLPVQLTPFVGRDSEKATLVQLISDPHHHLLTLMGPGGVGKTRMALEVAAYKGLNFADGIAFVPLASLGSVTQIIPAICEALNLMGSDTNFGSGGYLKAYISGRQMLLILDNFEHLLDGVDLISDILTGAPEVTILVTSRERLNLQAEWLFDLEGLSFPNPRELETLVPDSFASLDQYSAIQLFVQRALQVRPGLSFNPQTLLVIARICQHVAGMPLAIELAAATVRTYNISEIERQINQDLTSLATNLHDIPTRHRSMHAVFERSWNLLSNSEKILFSRLAVFRGGCTLQAAEKIVGASLLQLARLVDKSLLRHDETTIVPADLSSQEAVSLLPVITQRFFLLEPLREFATEKLVATGETLHLYQAHATYFLALVETTADNWDTPNSNQAIVELDRDYDNIRAVLSRVMESGDLVTGLRMGIALRRFWQRRGYYAEGRRWLETLLALEDPPHHPPTGDSSTGSTTLLEGLRAKALHTAAWLATDQHDYSRATELFDQSRDLRRHIGNLKEETILLAPEARQARAVGDYTRTVALREEALAYYRLSGDRGTFSSGGLGLALYELALALREQGDFQRARSLFEECLRLHEELGEREGIGIGLLGLSDLARDLADAPSIRRYCEPGLNLCRELGMQWPCGFFMNNLALAAYLENDTNLAANLINQTTSLFMEIQAPASLGEALITSGHILRARGQYTEAFAAFNTSLKQVQITGPRLMLVTALEGMAGLLAQNQVGAIEIAVQIQAGAAVMRQQMGTTHRPLDLSLQTEALTNAEQNLGAVKYQKLVEVGQKLSVTQMMALIAAAEPTITSSHLIVDVPGSISKTPGSPPVSNLSSPGGNISLKETGKEPINETVSENLSPGVLLDWGAAPAEASFYGRSWDLTLLMDWVIKKRDRVVSILGMGGVGKSALSIRLMRQAAPHFEAVIWRSLRDLPTCNELLDDLITVLASPGTGPVSGSFERKLSLFIQILQKKRVLLIWDNFETVLEEGFGTGEMRQGSEDFGRFLRRLGETFHNSCLVITSREKPVDLVRLEGNHSAIRTLQIARLDIAACEELLSELGVNGTAQDRKQLISNYGANPLALKIVSQTIHGVFGGDLARFLKQGESIYGGIRALLNEHLKRLSDLERRLLLWFAIFREPTTLEELCTVLEDPWPVGTVLETVEALLRRNLLERGQQPGSFLLQPVILDFATKNLVEEAVAEVVSGQLQILIQYNLEEAHASEFVRQLPKRLLLAPLFTRLRSYYPDKQNLDARLVELLEGLLDQPIGTQGYGPANLQGLLELLRGDLSGSI